MNGVPLCAVQECAYFRTTRPTVNNLVVVAVAHHTYDTVHETHQNEESHYQERKRGMSQ